MADAVHSFDTIVEYADNSGMSTNKVEVGGVVSIEGPDGQVTRVDATVLRSPGAKKQSIPGFIDDGTLTMTCEIRKAVFAALQALKNARAFKFWRVSTVDGASLIGEAFIQGLSGPSVPEDDRLTYTLTLCPTGGWDYSAGS